jgi:hypothetical protein
MIMRIWRLVAMTVLDRNLGANLSRTDFALVAMTGSKIHHMTVQMLFSFCRAWGKMPQRLIIVSDGTRSDDQIQKDFSFWKGDLILAGWESCVSSYQGDLNAMTKFAEQSVFGRKMAAMLHYAKEGPILFCDSDVLWFSPLKCMPDRSGTMIKVCQDIERSYNRDLISEMGWQHLDTRPPMNVGVVYLNGDLVREFPVMNEAIRRLQIPYLFPEQTILTAVCKEKDVWPMSEIHIDLDDVGQWFTENPKWAARHYVSIAKFKYWRDATRQNLMARLGRSGR